jgi:hypothetical protein
MKWTYVGEEQKNQSMESLGIHNGVRERSLQSVKLVSEKGDSEQFQPHVSTQSTFKKLDMF